MTTPALITELQRDEGCRLVSYPDPLSGAEPWTCGYGHTGPDVDAHTVWTQAQAIAALQSDIASAEAQLDQKLPWWRSLDDVRQDALCNACFNMGIGHLLGFHMALGALEARNYDEAAAEFLNSTWAVQVGARAQRIAEQIRTGIPQ